MPSDNPKVISYLRHENHALFTKFCKEHGISASEAINRLIEMTLGGTRSSISLDPNIKEMIEVEVSYQTEYLRNSLEAYLNEIRKRLEKIEAQAQTEQPKADTLPSEVSDQASPIEPDELNPSDSEELDQQNNSELPTFNETITSSVDTTENTHQPLKGSELARRLNINPATLTKNRSKENFVAWSASKDPDGVAWRYEPVDGLYHRTE